jgi:hypothetical protein
MGPAPSKKRKEERKEETTKKRERKTYFADECPPILYVDPGGSISYERARGPIAA